jgi:hypothetical protein
MPNVLAQERSAYLRCQTPTNWSGHSKVRMDLGLTDKTAFVLGASSGLGLAIAKCLADEKAYVVLSARKGERLDQALSAVKQRNAQGLSRSIYRTPRKWIKPKHIYAI